jgi:cell division protein ZipA
MDADVLRLILIVLGALLLLGIFLWDRHNRGARGLQASRREASGPHASLLRREPTLGTQPAGSPDETLAGEPDAELDRTLEELGGLVGGDRRMLPKRARSAQRAENSERPLPGPDETPQQGLFADDAIAEGDPFRHARADLPTLILQINIVAKEGPFEGSDILRAVQGVGMAHGDMQIFHRRDDKDPQRAVLFSMASMVEPGSFPLDDMGEFRTPGLTLFAQLPGPRDGLAVFSDMLFSAERLATELAGELQDETHSRLTRQTIEHLRSQILEHRRRVRLAKSKLGK